MKKILSTVVTVAMPQEQISFETLKKSIVADINSQDLTRLILAIANCKRTLGDKDPLIDLLLTLQKHSTAFVKSRSQDTLRLVEKTRKDVLSRIDSIFL